MFEIESNIVVATESTVESNIGYLRLGTSSASISSVMLSQVAAP